MCGRFNIISDPFTQLIMNIANEEFAPEHYQSRYNIAPTENVPVLLRQTSGAWAMRSMRWWLLPRWANEVSSQYTMFNAKAENLLKSRVFKPLFSSQRCIIPVTGYYEWSDRGGKKTPYLVTPETEPGFGFAGLWECWQKNGQIIESCTVITGAAPSSLSQLHGRVPLHLGPDEIKCWLGSGQFSTVFVGSADANAQNVLWGHPTEWICRQCSA